MENTTHQLNKNIGDLLVKIFVSSLFISAGFKRLYSSHVYEEVVLSSKCRVNYSTTALTFLLYFSGLVHGDDLKPFLSVFNPFTAVCEPITLYRTFIFCVATKKIMMSFGLQSANSFHRKQTRVRKNKYSRNK